LTDHGAFALRDFFLCTKQGFEVLKEAINSKDRRKIIHQTLQDVVAEAKSEQNTDADPNLQPAGSDDSFEILQVVPPNDGNLKPETKVKPEPTTLSSKPPTPKTGDVSGQKRKTCSSYTLNDDDNSEDTSPSLETVDILVRDIVGQWKSRAALVGADLKKHKVPVEGILT
jgi:hypothetical protein